MIYKCVLNTSFSYCLQSVASGLIATYCGFKISQP